MEEEAEAVDEVEVEALEDDCPKEEFLF